MRLTASHLRAFLCALLLVACVLLARPFAETGLNDDFSYVYSARALAATGHIHYVGWASAMLGWQLALGAFFAKLFGSSFTAVRSSMLLIAAVTTVVLHRVFIRFGLTERNATLSTLVVMLSPLSLPLAFSFMSDMSGVFCTVLCTYACLRALQAQAPQAAAGWLMFASLSNAIGGTARQTGWLCLFLMVPCTLFLLRRRRLPLLPVIAVWLLSLALVYGSLRWFSHQVYSVIELPVADYIDRELLLKFLVNVVRAAFQVCLFALPVLLAFVPFFPVRNRRALSIVAVATLPLLLVLAYMMKRHQLASALPPFNAEGNFVTARGMVYVPEIGQHVTVIPVWVQSLLAVAILISLAGLVSLLLRHAATARKAAETPRALLTWRQLLVLTVPFTAGYLLLVLHRALFANAFDRYFLPLLPLLLVAMVRLYQQRARDPQLPTVCYAALTAFTIFAIAGLHDTFAERRARVLAGDRLIAAGVPRTAFYGGFEYDGWTQIQQMGYMNVGYMVWPDGVHVDKPVVRKMHTKPCDQFFAQTVPAIQPRYGISFDQVACDGPSTFAPQAYSTWLPPYDQKLYIRSVTRKAY